MNEQIFDRIANRFMVAIICSIFLYLCLDFTRSIGSAWGQGWDLTSVCGGSFAYLNGRNPYAVKQYAFGIFPYTYLPFWLPATAGLCKALSITGPSDNLLYFPAFLGLFAFSTAFLTSRMRLIGWERMFLVAMIFGGFAGFPVVMRTANITFFEGIFLILALAFLFSHARTGDRRELWLFATMFGLFAAIKTITIVFVASFWFLPFELKDRLKAASIVIVIWCLPVVVSILFQYDLFLQFLAVHLNKIEGNINVNGHSPSFFWFFDDILQPLHMSGALRRSISSVLSGVVVMGGAAFAIGQNGLKSLLRSNRSGDVPFGLLGDRYDLFMVSIAIMQLLIPRIREYSFFLLAIVLGTTILRSEISRPAKLAVAAGMTPPMLFGQQLGGFDQLWWSAIVTYFLLIFLFPNSGVSPK